MSIKPQNGRRNYAKGGQVKGYLMGGGVDPNHPEKGVQGASEWYQPASVPTGEGAIGELGHIQFTGDQRQMAKPKEALEGDIKQRSGGLGIARENLVMVEEVDEKFSGFVHPRGPMPLMQVHHHKDRPDTSEPIGYRPTKNGELEGFSASSDRALAKMGKTSEQVGHSLDVPTPTPQGYPPEDYKKGGPVIHPVAKGLGLQAAPNFARGGAVLNHVTRSPYAKDKYAEGGEVYNPRDQAYAPMEGSSYNPNTNMYSNDEPGYWIKGK